MALTNAQYDAIMRQYDLDRQQAVRELEERRALVYARDEKIRAIDEAIAEAGIAAAKAAVNGDLDAKEQLDRTIADYRKQRDDQLTLSGFDRDALEVHYRCPICEDTGFADGDKCICFRKKESAILRTYASFGDVLSYENFDAFSFDWYADHIIDEKSKKTALEMAEDAYDAARRLCGAIGERDANLLLQGETGVGKTFLTHCIAKEALDRSYRVLYFTAQDLMDTLADAVWHRSAEASQVKEMIDGCDLLIIDDLGTELTNAFVSAQLFRIINDRILDRRSTVISTNLSLAALRDAYSDRVFSRIMQHYTVVRMIGDDIRLSKKLQGGNS